MGEKGRKNVKKLKQSKVKKQEEVNPYNNKAV